MYNVTCIGSDGGQPIRVQQGASEASPPACNIIIIPFLNTPRIPSVSSIDSVSPRSPGLFIVDLIIRRVTGTSIKRKSVTCRYKIWWKIIRFCVTTDHKFHMCVCDCLATTAIYQLWDECR